MKESLKKYYAHTPPKETPLRWHLLEDHLIETANAAYVFAKNFGCENSGFTLGVFHDLGKVNPAFQAYLEACFNGKKGDSIPHSICGAAYLWKILLKQNSGNISLAIPALGHHGGLGAEGLVVTSGGELDNWWNNTANKGLKVNMQDILKLLPLKIPEILPKDEFSKELRLRMLFSALVDADYLNTEKHFDPQTSIRRKEWTILADLWPILRTNQLHMMWEGRHTGKVNQTRRQIYFSCYRAGSLEPGVFRLTVPTGGGKTRSGLVFALRHAITHREHGFRRVIVALPYTSIIDQNARVYRDIFGENFVLEQHSQVEMPKSDYQDEIHLRQQLASENWDYPLIITTTVQLFESLFSNKPSKCRKLHNIARSIIILDEVQTLPPELLKPTMDVLRILVKEYGVTLVLSTATQPAFDKTPYLKAFNGLNIREIVPDFKWHFKELERVEYQPIRQFNSLSILAEELAEPENSRVLVILNTRKHALELFDHLRRLGVEGLYHLSTLLCGAHRKTLLAEINERLGASSLMPVRLISTQVVEAGVDLDFPLVYRVIGPLDRIVQAAGRCDREGKGTATGNKGKMVIFDFPDNASPPGAYKIGLEEAKTLLSRNTPERLHDPELHSEYFKMLFRDVNLDKKDIQGDRYNLDFPRVAEKYKLIEDSVPVVISTYSNDEGESHLQDYLRKPSRENWRRLMPFVVNLSYRDLHNEDIKGCIDLVSPGLYRWIGGYDTKTHRGITGILRDPADLCV